MTTRRIVLYLDEDEYRELETAVEQWGREYEDRIADGWPVATDRYAALGTGWARIADAWRATCPTPNVLGGHTYEDSVCIRCGRVLVPTYETEDIL